ncbi:MAG: copper chaperone PCu(A)C [Proteobacteria bacterium]|nr:copper chaperone PCu(A)C [Pseudomonadota bacterium]
MKNFITLLTTVLIVNFGPIGHANEISSTAGVLTIDNAWVAEAPPVSKVMVAYLTISNMGYKAITITNAESELYSSIEFHETIHENGMARMVRHDELVVPASSSLELKRGGKHLMLFNPSRRLKVDDTVTIKLTTTNGTIKTISVPVKKAQY